MKRRSLLPVMVAGPAMLAQLRQALLAFQTVAQRPAGVFNAPLHPVSADMQQGLLSLVEPAREMLKPPR